MRLLARIAAFLFTLLCLLSAMNDRSNIVRAMMEQTLSGNWGGDHISLELDARGGRVEYDCAHGALDAQITLDAQGRFRVAGRYVEEHGGPTRQGEAERGYAVWYTGQVKNDEMTLTVTRADRKTALGRFTLKRGQEAFLVKCK